MTTPVTFPPVNRHPAFDITRISHIVLTSRDLGATRAFYEGVLGFDVTDQTANALYLRGIEERGHHSLVFERSDDAPCVRRIGWRMFADEDLRAAHDGFRARGIEALWVDRPYQGPTLHLRDAAGIPLEFCATMEQRPSLLQQFHRHHGARPIAFDHVQILVPDVARLHPWYADLGFRVSEYIARPDGDEALAVWLQRKGSTQDVVFNTGAGPRNHHFAFHCAGVADLIQAADSAAAQGMAHLWERGPGRHGIGNALFIYFRDPDGHRVELFTDHYQTHDLDFEPIRWDPADLRLAQLWGHAGTNRFYLEADAFEDTPQTDSRLPPRLVTLEKLIELAG